MKWSDGQPFTADDFVFWFEDIYLNKELVPDRPSPLMSINGKPGKIEKVDETDRPVRLPGAVLPARRRAGRRDADLGSHALQGGDVLRLVRAGPLPEAVPAEVRRPGQGRQDGEGRPASTTGSTCSSSRTTGRSTPTCRSLTPWKTTTPINTPTWTLERNPYCIWVDTEGNQLPYIDKIQLTLAENLEVLNLRAIAGEYDLQERHIDMRQAAGLPGEPAEGQLQAVTSIPATTARTAASSST